MNLVDNGVKEILAVKRVIGKEEMYFLVQFIDYYDKPRIKKFRCIKNIAEMTWTE